MQFQAGFEVQPFFKFGKKSALKLHRDAGYGSITKKYLYCIIVTCLKSGFH